MVSGPDILMSPLVGARPETQCVLQARALFTRHVPAELALRQMSRMTLYSAACTESPPYFSISGKMLQTPRALFLRRLMAVTTSACITSG